MRIFLVSIIALPLTFLSLPAQAAMQQAAVHTETHQMPIALTFLLVFTGILLISAIVLAATRPRRRKRRAAARRTTVVVQPRPPRRPRRRRVVVIR